LYFYKELFSLHVNRLLKHSNSTALIFTALLSVLNTDAHIFQTIYVWEEPVLEPPTNDTIK